MNTSGPLFHHTGNVRSAGGRMAKIANYAALFFAMAIFAITSANLLGPAFAWTVSNGSYSHEHVTNLTNPNAVCGNHLCASGEIPQHPPVVTPVKGIQ